MPYCSSIHISQPPGMLFAPFHNPTFVAGLRRKPSTAGTRSTPATAMPSVFAEPSTIFCAAGVGGITHVPAAYFAPCASKAFPARYTGTLAFCSSATVLKNPYVPGSTR